MNKNKLPESWHESTFVFFKLLAEAAAGNASAQISMYDLGERLGLTRSEASRTAELIMSEGWAEVRTLSGGIGLTQAGIDACHAMSAGTQGETAVVAGLGTSALLETNSLRSVEAAVSGLKLALEKGGFGFDVLSELLADIRTIDAQLASPRPKTAILRACFKSILGVLASAGHTDQTDRIKRLIE